MITLKLKNIENLKQKAGKRNLIIQCSFCPSWNFPQDEIEKFAGSINSEIQKIPTICNRPAIKVDLEKYDVVFVLACGAGIQIISESVQREVIPAADTTGIGVKFKDKIEIYCKACGDCILDETAGICPIVRCSKSLINGPCGGVHNGMCEVNNMECGWVLILDRMRELGNLEKFLQTRMPKPEK